MTATATIEEADGLFGKSKVFIDLKDAFNQISREQVFLLFHRAFYLNKTDANWLADHMVCDGFLFQGNPAAPLIFNILSRYIGMNVAEMTKGQIQLVQYADDLTFIVNRDYVPCRMVRFINKMVRWCGWTPNTTKTEVRKAGLRWSTLGLRRQKDGFEARSQRLIKKKIHYWSYLVRVRKFRHSLRVNKAGHPIGIVCIQKGLLAWLEGINQHLQASPSIKHRMRRLYDEIESVSSLIEMSETIPRS